MVDVQSVASVWRAEGVIRDLDSCRWWRGSWLCRFEDYAVNGEGNLFLGEGQTKAPVRR